MNNLLCGGSCVLYILNDFKLNIKKINNKMIWITELALSLKENGIQNVEILCYKSNLFFDYNHNKERNLNYKGFFYIEKCLSNKINIKEIKLSEEELIRELKENKFIVLCVQSSRFNNKKMSGGHFIILNGMYHGKVRIINPIKDKYEYRIENTKNVIKYCEDYGAWRILVKEDRSD